MEGEVVRVALCCPLQSVRSTPEYRTESPDPINWGEGGRVGRERREAQGSGGLRV